MSETELEKLSLKFFEYEEGKGKSRSTIKIYRKGLQVLFKFLKGKGISNPAQVTKPLLLEYFDYLCNYVGLRGKPASNVYKNHLLWSMKLFFIFLARFEYLRHDPSSEIESIKEQRGLPHICMTVLNLVKKYAFRCGFRKNITTHSFRVSCFRPR